MGDSSKYDDVVDRCDALLRQNEHIPSSSDVLKKTRRESVHSDECIREDRRKIVLYNIRYDSTGAVRSDIDILNELAHMEEFEVKICEYMELLTKELYELNTPGTLERVERTVTTWAWSDEPRKERIVRRKQIEKKLKTLSEMVGEIHFQIPLYRSVVSVTTTTEIQLKAQKLKAKYAKKLKQGKKSKH